MNITALAISALRSILAELENGELDVLEFRYRDEERLEIRLVAAAAPQKGCPKCGSPEVKDAGGLDRICIQCQSTWTKPSQE